MKIKVDTVVHYILASKLIQLVTNTNLPPFEVVQRCQHCQLYTLWENLRKHKGKRLFL